MVGDSISEFRTGDISIVGNYTPVRKLTSDVVRIFIPKLHNIGIKLYTHVLIQTK